MPLALQIKSLNKIYRKNNVIALDNVNLDIAQGDFFSLLGENGAGKTTLLGIICGLINKTAGHVSIFGIDIDADFSAAKQHIGIVPQEMNFNIFEKVIDIVVNQAGYYGIGKKEAYRRAEYYLKKMDLWHKRNMPSMTLSGGMKRRLLIVRALIHNPRILILDEPTAGVDIALRRHMWEFFKELNAKGVTIILTTHYLEEAEYLCKNIAVINDGNIMVNTRMHNLLAKLPKQIFVLESGTKISRLPHIEGYNCKLVSDNNLEVEVSSSQTLNPVFDSLTRKKVDIVSVRPKTGRLEESFLSLISGHKT